MLLKMIDGMLEHFEKTKGKSLLARYYGMFTVQTNMFQQVSIIIMQNTVKL